MTLDFNCAIWKRTHMKMNLKNVTQLTTGRSRRKKKQKKKSNTAIKHLQLRTMRKSQQTIRRRENAQTEEMASFEDAIGGPAKVELQVEKLLPVIRGERERFLANEGRN